MCGFIGIIGSDLKNILSSEKTQKISESLKHRGPDSEGLYVSDDNSIIMMHRRLSILDLSEKGQQPMCSQCGRFIISFNGEIYNHQKLRNDKNLISYKWKGTSDTETLMRYFEIYGIDKTLEDIEGMFSFVIYDTQFNTLYLARDRSGEKPLLYGTIDGLFIFGSELSFLKILTNVKLNLDEKYLNQYFFYGYTKETLFKEIKKIQPGSYLEVLINSDGSTFLKEPKRYWEFSAKLNLKKFDTNEIDHKFHKKIENVINKQMISDVPIGAFLSSGVDSSLIVSIMSKLCEKKLKTFTVGFENKKIDETDEAKKIAKHLNTDHYEVHLSDKKIAEIIPNIFNYFDFPLSDPSIIPTYLVSYVAKNHVKVALSGDGGDELFLGYKRYLDARNIRKKISFIPKPLRSILNFIISHTSKKIINLSNLSENRLKKIQNILNNNEFQNIYQNILCKNFPELILKKYHSFENYQINIENDHSNFYDYMSEFDFQNYLPNDILFKLDICSMRNSLETRAPFLDKEILEFVKKVPNNLKIDQKDNQKVLIKKVLSNYLPNQLISKKKMGFGLHLNILLKKSLLDWAENLIEFLRKNDDEYVDYNLVKKYWEMFKKNEQINEHFIWNVLSYLAWKKNWQNKVYFSDH